MCACKIEVREKEKKIVVQKEEKKTFLVLLKIGSFSFLLSGGEVEFWGLLSTQDLSRRVFQTKRLALTSKDLLPLLWLWQFTISPNIKIFYISK